MRRTTKGRNVQHVCPSPERTIETKVPNKRNKSGFSIKKKVIPAILKGYVIKHQPRRVSDATAAGNTTAAYVRWQDCEGAKRRGWS
jgi:hypothetical protein